MYMLTSEAEILRLHRNLQVHVIESCGNKWSALLRNVDQNHWGALSKAGLIKTCRQTLRISEDAVSNADLQLLHTILDRDCTGTVDLRELACFLAASSAEATQNVLRSREDPTLRGPRLWGVDSWRGQATPRGRPYTVPSAPPTAAAARAAATARRSRAVAQRPGAAATLTTIAEALVRHHGSLECAHKVLDIFKDGQVTQGEFELFLKQTLRIPIADTRHVACLFETLDIDGARRLSVLDLQNALEARTLADKLGDDNLGQRMMLSGERVKPITSTLACCGKGRWQGRPTSAPSFGSSTRRELRWR